MKRANDHLARAQHFSDWMRKQIDLAEREPDASVRLSHMTLAEPYMRLAERHLVAAMRLGKPPHKIAERTISTRAARTLIFPHRQGKQAQSPRLLHPTQT